MKNYTELLKIKGYYDRLKYLMLDEIQEGGPGKKFHVRNRKKWDSIRTDILIRDCFYDLAIPGMDIQGRAYVHHINPVTQDMIDRDDPLLYDPENLISVSYDTHYCIHYKRFPIEVPSGDRKPGDTKLF